MTTFCTPRAFRRLAFVVFSLSTSVLQAAAPAAFDIPAQPAPAAIKLFTKQSGAQVVYVYDDLKVITSRAIKGDMIPDEAIVRLLPEADFIIEATGNGNFTVSRQAVARPGSIDGVVRSEESSRGVAGARVSLSGTDKFVLSDKHGRFTIENVPPGTQELRITAEGLRQARVTDVTVKAGNRHTLSPIVIPVQAQGVLQLETYTVSAKKNDGVLELDPYSVEGRKEKPFVSGNMDIPRTINDAQPYYVFDAKTLDTSGAINIEDFLKQRLTMNTTIQTNGEIAGQNLLGNTSSINLRGVGTDKTLILVNGRRMAGVTIQADNYQPDLNGIPLSAIERIEVLPSSASGIYGGSAMGGVVNVILKQNYTGGELRLSYDNYWDTDAAKRTASLSYGMSLEGGKTHVTLSASWSDSTPLLLQDGVGIYQKNLDTLQRNAPTFIFSSTTPVLGNLPNIIASPSSVTTLVLKPAYGGTVLNSRNTYVPAGTAPGTSTAQLAAGFLVNAGQWNQELPLTTQFPTGLLRPIGSPVETRAFRVGVRRQTLPRLQLSADFSYNDNQTDSIYSITTTMTVPTAAPTNPFTSNVSVRVPDASRVPMTSRSQSKSATIGAVADLPWGWTGSLDYTWSANRFEYLFYNQDGSARTADLLSGALNPLADTLQYPLDLAKYLIPVTYQGASRLHDFSLRGSGSLPALPWGQPTLTMGMEHRIAQTPERIEKYEYPVSVFESYAYKYYARKSTTDSGYAEASLPLIKQAWLPGVHALDLQLSGRSERYAVDTGTTYEFTYYNRTPPTVDYVGTTLNGQPYFSTAAYTSSNYTVGLKYQPVKEVTLRVSRATAFLPPIPAQLIKNPVQSTTTTNVLDPVTGLQTAVYTLTGGNPDLKPQNSESFNVGVIWEPMWKPLRGLRLNAEYYKIEQFDAIGSLGAQEIVNQESLYPGRVTRNSSGTITLVDYSLVNLYHRETEGWDLSAAYRLQTSVGTFHLNAMQTIILHLKNQYTQTQPEFDAVNFPSESGAAKYKSNVTLTWERRGWSAGWTARYFGSYKQYGVAGGPYSLQYANGGVYDARYITAGGSDTIPSQTYHDAFIGYAFREKKSVSDSQPSTLSTKLLSGLSVQLNVRNVFDKVAPLDAFYSSSYYLSPYGGGLAGMRSYVITVKKAF